MRAGMTLDKSKVCWDCGVKVGKPHGQTDYGRCDGYVEQGGYFVRPVSGVTPPRPTTEEGRLREALRDISTITADTAWWYEGNPTPLRAALRTAHERAAAALAAPPSEQEEPPDHAIRNWLWNGCVHDGKYGDDGELQCRGADFRRDPIPALIVHIVRAASTPVPTLARDELVRIVGQALYGWGPTEPNDATGFTARFESEQVADAIYRRLSGDEGGAG